MPAWTPLTVFSIKLNLQKGNLCDSFSGNLKSVGVLRRQPDIDNARSSQRSCLSSPISWFQFTHSNRLTSLIQIRESHLKQSVHLSSLILKCPHFRFTSCKFFDRPVAISSASLNSSSFHCLLSFYAFRNIMESFWQGLI